MEGPRRFEKKSRIMGGGGGVVVVASFGLLKKVVADWFIVLIFSFIPLL